MTEYALYKGEELIVIGTIEEIAKHQKVKIQTVRFWTFPAYEKRIANSKNAKVLVKLDG